MRYPGIDDTYVPQSHDPSLEICFTPLKDGSIAEMTIAQFNQIMAGETIAGVSKSDFVERPVNRYAKVR